MEEAEREALVSAKPQGEDAVVLMSFHYYDDEDNTKNLTYLILQFSLEGGWANGLDPLATPYLGSHDPGSGTAFGALSVRITL